MKCCSHCGHEVSNEAVVCDQCGWSLENNYTQKQATPEQKANAYYAVNSIRTNPLSLIGFIVSFFVAIVGFIFSIIGLCQLKRNPNEKGQGFAIAGIVIGFLGILWQAIYLILRFAIIRRWG